MFFKYVYFYIFNFKRFVANFYILLFYHHPPSTSVPRNLNIQGFLGKTDNHWMDKTNILKIPVHR